VEKDVKGKREFGCGEVGKVCGGTSGYLSKELAELLGVSVWCVFKALRKMKITLKKMRA
jgi:hypothetical protein